MRKKKEIEDALKAEEQVLEDYYQSVKKIRPKETEIYVEDPFEDGNIHGWIEALKWVLNDQATKKRK